MFLFAMQQNVIKFAWEYFGLETDYKSREFISDAEELSVDFDTDHTVIGFSLHTATYFKNTIHRSVCNLRMLTLIYYVL